jgi:hypothetical protein
MYTKVRPSYNGALVYDPRLMEHMTYRNQISDPVPQQDPEIQYDYDRKFVFVSSASRDREQYPDPAYFKVQLPETYRDVVSVELCAGVLPNRGGIHSDGYILLDVQELNHISNVDGTSCFGILGLQYHPNNGFFNIEKGNTSAMPVQFKPPKGRLDTLTIAMRHPDGSRVLFGDEDPGNPADLSYQTALTFEVRTRIRRRTGIDRDPRATPTI